jgi:hypothetical protein
VAHSLPWKGIEDKRREHCDVYDPEGPVVRFVYRVYDRGLDQPPHVLDTWLNPSTTQLTSEGRLIVPKGGYADRDVLEALTRVETYTLHAFGASGSLPHLGSKLLPWRETYREQVAALLRATDGRATRWPSARQRAEREHPISSLEQPSV